MKYIDIKMLSHTKPYVFEKDLAKRYTGALPF